MIRNSIDPARLKLREEGNSLPRTTLRRTDPKQPPKADKDATDCAITDDGRSCSPTQWKSHSPELLLMPVRWSGSDLASAGSVMTTALPFYPAKTSRILAILLSCEDPSMTREMRSAVLSAALSNAESGVVAYRAVTLFIR